MSGRILIVDDERNLRVTLAEILVGSGFEVVEAASGDEARRLVRDAEPDVVFCDWRMADGGGEAFLRALQDDATLSQRMPVIVMTAYGTSDVTIRAMQLGAYDFVTKPLDLDELCATAHRAVDHARLQREVEHLRGQLRPEGADPSGHMIGSPRPMLEVFKAIGRAAPTDSSVLIQGESGTGKELVASAIHENSPRRRHPFVAINCAALPADLLEAELFGYEKGAFTGAGQRRVGKLEAANGGTVLLDEIGELTLALQPKLLRVLQDHTFERLGGNERVQSDFRVLAASNRDLSDAVRDGAVRQDLYFRLNTVTVTVPPLRERRSDIVPLAEHFAARIAARDGKGAPAFTEPALVALQQYGYPGNVRELEHVVERALMVSQGRVILPEHLTFGQPRAAGEPGWESLFALPFHESVEAWEKLRIQRALQESGGSKTDAARRLGIRRRLLYEKLKRWQLE